MNRWIIKDICRGVTAAGNGEAYQRYGVELIVQARLLLDTDLLLISSICFRIQQAPSSSASAAEQ